MIGFLLISFQSSLYAYPSSMPMLRDCLPEISFHASVSRIEFRNSLLFIISPNALSLHCKINSVVSQIAIQTKKSARAMISISYQGFMAGTFRGHPFVQLPHLMQSGWRKPSALSRLSYGFSCMGHTAEQILHLVVQLSLITMRR